MAKLYPPYIEGTLPAFCLNEGGGELVIPFAHNRAISEIGEIKGFAIKIKTVQNDVLLGDVESNNWDRENNVVIFPVQNYKIDGLNDLEFKIGQYYKIQLAYINEDGNIGYYSTVGVVKCTSEPTVAIDNFDANKVNNNAPEFIGTFKQAENGDISEKVYSSKFIITDLRGNEIFNTGDVLHSIENNPNSYESHDSVYFNRDLNYGEIYKIQYIVTTTNGLVYSSPKYLLTQQKSINMELKGDLIATLNYDEGFADVALKGFIDEAGGEEIVDGLFILSREDSLKPGVWEELTRFSLKHEYPTRTIFRDFTIEQGKTYTYSLQQYNANSVYSDRKKSNQLYADFEDMFLYDGERQLKLRFNPQVSSFKMQLSETRTDTIGNKYPFFFRNARVGYKTFPISGLVSMLSDENEFFIKFEDILRTKREYDRESTPVTKSKKIWPPIIEKNTDLVSKNYASERLFKMEVLDWLNNGHVKLFKSPSEGNYLVRLMDSSLSPNAQLGRMLHTVNSTAYECAETNYRNLVENNIIKEITLDDRDTYVSNWRAHSLPPDFFTNGGKLNLNNNIVSGSSRILLTSSAATNHSENLLISEDVSGAYTTMLRFLEFLPGDQIELVFNPSGEFIEPDNLNRNSGIIITIGSTGNYYVDDIKPVYGIYVLLDKEKEQQFSRTGQPSITYLYDTPTRTVFRSIEETQADVGGYYNFVGKDVSFNLIDVITYMREVPTHICFSRYFKRPIEFLFYNSNNLTIAKDDNIYNGWWEESNIDIGYGYRKLKTKYRNSAKEQNYYSLNSKHKEFSHFYWTQDFNENEVFDDKENMEYSPYSLYVLCDEYLNNPSRKDSIIDHMAHAPYMPDDDEKAYHAASHIFEKYHIDRLVHAHTPEELLTLHTLMAMQLAEENIEEEISIVNDAVPLYVLDPWYGKIYQVGVNFMYDPSIIYNEEKIELREIDRYDLEDMEPTDTSIIIGNGIYGDIFYQKVTQTFAYEPKDKKVIWESAVAAVKNSSIGYREEAAERFAYNILNAAIDAAREEWQSLIEGE